MYSIIFLNLNIVVKLKSIITGTNKRYNMKFIIVFEFDEVWKNV